MKYFPVILFAVFFIYWSQDISARTCYQCEENNCTSDPANPVDCGEDYVCGIHITTVFGWDNLYPPGINRRYCKKNSSDYPAPYGCVVGHSGNADISEMCLCDEDLCNAKEPDCSERVLQSKQIRKSLAEICKDEIEKYKLENDNGNRELYLPFETADNGMSLYSD